MVSMNRDFDAYKQPAFAWYRQRLWTEKAFGTLFDLVNFQAEKRNIFDKYESIVAESVYSNRKCRKQASASHN